jgi:hypothetical protein
MLVFAPSDALAQTVIDDKRTDAERHQDRADALRRAAQDRAQAQLGYPSLRASLPPPTAADYWALSQQIARLGAALQALAASAAMPVAPPMVGPPIGSGAAGDGSVASIYGPDGPTAKAVNLLLEYRLMVAGNPRLKVGKIVEEPDRILAQVVTRDGSVVEEYAVDRATGAWVPLR